MHRCRGATAVQMRWMVHGGHAARQWPHPHREACRHAPGTPRGASPRGAGPPVQAGAPWRAPWWHRGLAAAAAAPHRGTHPWRWHTGTCGISLLTFATWPSRSPPWLLSMDFEIASVTMKRRCRSGWLCMAALARWHEQHDSATSNCGCGWCCIGPVWPISMARFPAVRLPAVQGEEGRRGGVHAGPRARKAGLGEPRRHAGHVTVPAWGPRIRARRAPGTHAWLTWCDVRVGEGGCLALPAEALHTRGGYPPPSKVNTSGSGLEAHHRHLRRGKPWRRAQPPEGRSRRGSPPLSGGDGGNQDAADCGGLVQGAWFGWGEAMTNQPVKVAAAAAQGGGVWVQGGAGGRWRGRQMAGAARSGAFQLAWVRSRSRRDSHLAGRWRPA